MAEEKIETLDGLFERARELMRSGKLTQEEKNILKDCKKIYDTNGILPEYITTKSGNNVAIIPNLREDETKKVSTIIPAGEELRSVYTEEQMAVILRMSAMIAKHGSIVKTEKKENWKTAKRIGSMIVAVALTALIATGIGYCQKQNAMIVVDNETQVTDVVAVETEQTEQEEKEEEKIDLSLLERRKDDLEQMKALFTNYQDCADNIYDVNATSGQKYKSISEYIEDIEKNLQQIEEALNNPNLTKEEFDEIYSEAYWCYNSGNTIKLLIGGFQIEQAAEQTK